MVIKKRISLDFLGEEYKEGYLEFKGIALKDFEKYLKESESLQKKGGAESVRFIVETLKAQFLSGKFPSDSDELQLQDVTVDEIGDLDITAATKIFSLLTGQELPPK